jgi:hypothetical protein
MQQICADTYYRFDWIPSTDFNYFNNHQWFATITSRVIRRNGHDNFRVYKRGL